MKILNKTKELLTNVEALEIVNKIADNSNEFQKIKTKIASICNGCTYSEKTEQIKIKLREFGLNLFETINIINTCPTELVHLQLIVEEMTDRLTEQQMEEILIFFKN